MAKKRPTQGVVGYVDRVMAELTQQAPKAIRDGDETAVHHARVATRRLGAAMDVVSPLIGSEDQRLIRQSLKKIRRSVQVLRDLDVMQGHLAERKKKGLHGELCNRLKLAMASKRQQTFSEVAAAARVERWLSRVGHWMALRGALLAREDQIGDLLVSALSEQFGAFAQQAERLSAGVLGEQGHGDIEPHALRIAGKSLRYTFEMAQAQGLPVLDATLRIYKRLQDALGLWHDYHVLSQHIMQCCLAEMEHPPFRWDEDQMMQLAMRVIRDSHRQLSVFARLWRKHRMHLAQQLSGVLPPPAVTPVAANVTTAVTSA